MKKLVLFAAIALSISACGSKRMIKMDGSDRVEVKDTIAVWAEWAKDKKRGFDVKFNFLNTSKKDQIFYTTDLYCFNGSMQGTVSYAGATLPNNEFRLNAGQMRNFILICDIGSDLPSKDFKVTVRSIYEAKGDDPTKSKPLVKDLNWVNKSAATN